MTESDQRSKDTDLQTFRKAVESAGHAIYWTDTDGTIEYVNAAFEKQTGYSAEEAIGQNARILQSGVHDDDFYDSLWTTILDGEVWTGELINERKGGERYILKQTIAPITDQNGEIVRFVAVNEEITELRRSQEELEHERNRLGSLLDAVPTPLVFVGFEDTEPIVRRTNRAFDETFGPTEATLIGSSLDEVIVAEPNSEQSQAINQDLQQGKTIRQEVTRETADGQTRTFLLEATPFDQDGVKALGTYTDITERKRAERKQQLLTDVSQIIGEADSFSEGLEKVLRAICEYTDWCYGEVWLPSANGQKLEFASGCTCSADSPSFDQFTRSSKSVTFEPNEGLPGRVFASKTSEWIPDVTDESNADFHRSTLAENVGLHAAFGVPIIADDENVVAVLTFFLETYGDIDETLVEDITDVVANLDGLVARKQFEQQIKEQRDHLKTLNQVIRHDIRNDLQLITAYADLAEEHVDSEGEEYLATVQKCAKNAVGLTRTARELAEMLLRTDVETHPIAIGQTLEHQISEVTSTHPDAVIEIEGSLAQTWVVGNELLESVFRNLIQNAILHNDKEVPKITIQASTTEELVELRFADNGPGISDSNKEVIFAEGEKSHDSDGSGLGLYLVKSLVNSYGGDVWVEDNEPEGAIFVVQLPMADKSV